MTHTGPEMAAERRICAKVMRRIRDDPCAHCIHRVDGWSKSACMGWRTFPACMDQATGPNFTLDPDTITERSEAA